MLLKMAEKDWIQEAVPVSVRYFQTKNSLESTHLSAARRMKMVNTCLKIQESERPISDRWLSEEITNFLFWVDRRMTASVNFPHRFEMSTAMI